MKKGRLFVSPGFLLLTALGFLWLEADLGMALILAFLFHETAHIALLSICGGRLRSLRLTLKGALIITEQGSMGYGGELVSVMAGPGVNLFLSVLSARGGKPFYLFSGINLILGMFNLLPIPGLDGWEMCRLLFALLRKEEKQK